MIMVGEHTGCCKNENEIVTKTLKSLGGGIEIEGGTLQHQLGQNDLNDLQVMSGIKELGTAAWASLRVDKSVTEVLATSNSNKIFCADQMLKKGRVTVWAD